MDALSECVTGLDRQLSSGVGSVSVSVSVSDPVHAAVGGTVPPLSPAQLKQHQGCLKKANHALWDMMSALSDVSACYAQLRWVSLEGDSCEPSIPAGSGMSALETKFRAVLGVCASYRRSLTVQSGRSVAFHTHSVCLAQLAGYVTSSVHHLETFAAQERAWSGLGVSGALCVAKEVLKYETQRHYTLGILGRVNKGAAMLHRQGYDVQGYLPLSEDALQALGQELESEGRAGRGCGSQIGLIAESLEDGCRTQVTSLSLHNLCHRLSPLLATLTHILSLPSLDANVRLHATQAAQALLRQEDALLGYLGQGCTAVKAKGVDPSHVATLLPATYSPLFSDLRRALSETGGTDLDAYVDAEALAEEYSALATPVCESLSSFLSRAVSVLSGTPLPLSPDSGPDPSGLSLAGRRLASAHRLLTEYLAEAASRQDALAILGRLEMDLGSVGCGVPEPCLSGRALSLSLSLCDCLVSVLQGIADTQTDVVQGQTEGVGQVQAAQASLQAEVSSLERHIEVCLRPIPSEAMRDRDNIDSGVQGELRKRTLAVLQLQQCIPEVAEAALAPAEALSALMSSPHPIPPETVRSLSDGLLSDLTRWQDVGTAAGLALQTLAKCQASYTSHKDAVTRAVAIEAQMEGEVEALERRVPFAAPSELDSLNDRLSVIYPRLQVLQSLCRVFDPASGSGDTPPESDALHSLLASAVEGLGAEDVCRRVDTLVGRYRDVRQGLVDRITVHSHRGTGDAGGEDGLNGTSHRPRPETMRGYLSLCHHLVSDVSERLMGLSDGIRGLEGGDSPAQTSEESLHSDPVSLLRLDNPSLLTSVVPGYRHAALSGEGDAMGDALADREAPASGLAVYTGLVEAEGLAKAQLGLLCCQMLTALSQYDALASVATHLAHMGMDADGESALQGEAGTVSDTVGERESEGVQVVGESQAKIDSDIDDRWAQVRSTLSTLLADLSGRAGVVSSSIQHPGVGGLPPIPPPPADLPVPADIPEYLHPQALLYRAEGAIRMCVHCAQTLEAAVQAHSKAQGQLTEADALAGDLTQRVGGLLKAYATAGATSASLSASLQTEYHAVLDMRGQLGQAIHSVSALHGKARGVSPLALPLSRLKAAADSIDVLVRGVTALADSGTQRDAASQLLEGEAESLANHSHGVYAGVMAVMERAEAALTEVSIGDASQCRQALSVLRETHAMGPDLLHIVRDLGWEAGRERESGSQGEKIGGDNSLTPHDPVSQLLAASPSTASMKSLEERIRRFGDRAPLRIERLEAEAQVLETEQRLCLSANTAQDMCREACSVLEGPTVQVPQSLRIEWLMGGAQQVVDGAFTETPYAAESMAAYLEGESLLTREGEGTGPDSAAGVSANGWDSLVVSMKSVPPGLELLTLYGSGAGDILRDNPSPTLSKPCGLVSSHTQTHVEGWEQSISQYAERVAGCLVDQCCSLRAGSVDGDNEDGADGSETPESVSVDRALSVRRDRAHALSQVREAVEAQTQLTVSRLQACVAVASQEGHRAEAALLAAKAYDTHVRDLWSSLYGAMSSCATPVSIATLHAGQAASRALDKLQATVQGLEGRVAQCRAEYGTRVGVVGCVVPPLIPFAAVEAVHSVCVALLDDKRDKLVTVLDALKGADTLRLSLSDMSLVLNRHTAQARVTLQAMKRRLASVEDASNHLDSAMSPVGIVSAIAADVQTLSQTHFSLLGTLDEMLCVDTEARSLLAAAVPLGSVLLVDREQCLRLSHVSVQQTETDFTRVTLTLMTLTGSLFAAFQRLSLVGQHRLFLSDEVAGLRDVVARAAPGMSKLTAVSDPFSDTLPGTGLGSIPGTGARGVYSAMPSAEQYRPESVFEAQMRELSGLEAEAEAESDLCPPVASDDSTALLAEQDRLAHVGCVLDLHKDAAAETHTLLARLTEAGLVSSAMAQSVAGVLSTFDAAVLEHEARAQQNQDKMHRRGEGAASVLTSYVRVAASLSQWVSQQRGELLASLEADPTADTDTEVEDGTDAYDPEGVSQALCDTYLGLAGALGSDSAAARHCCRGGLRRIALTEEVAERIEREATPLLSDLESLGLELEAVSGNSGGKRETESLGTRIALLRTLCDVCKREGERLVMHGIGVHSQSIAEARHTAGIQGILAAAEEAVDAVEAKDRTPTQGSMDTGEGGAEAGQVDMEGMEGLARHAVVLSSVLSRTDAYLNVTLPGLVGISGQVASGTLGMLGATDSGLLRCLNDTLQLHDRVSQCYETTETAIVSSLSLSVSVQDYLTGVAAVLDYCQTQAKALSLTRASLSRHTCPSAQVLATSVYAGLGMRAQQAEQLRQLHASILQRSREGGEEGAASIADLPPCQVMDDALADLTRLCGDVSKRCGLLTEVDDHVLPASLSSLSHRALMVLRFLNTFRRTILSQGTQLTSCTSARHALKLAKHIDKLKTQTLQLGEHLEGMQQDRDVVQAAEAGRVSEDGGIVVGKEGVEDETLGAMGLTCARLVSLAEQGKTALIRALERRGAMLQAADPSSGTADLDGVEASLTLVRHSLGAIAEGVTRVTDLLAQQPVHAEDPLSATAIASMSMSQTGVSKVHPSQATRHRSIRTLRQLHSDCVSLCPDLSKLRVGVHKLRLAAVSKGVRDTDSALASVLTVEGAVTDALDTHLSLLASVQGLLSGVEASVLGDMVGTTLTEHSEHLAVTLREVSAETTPLLSAVSERVRAAKDSGDREALATCLSTVQSIHAQLSLAYCVEGHYLSLSGIIVPTQSIGPGVDAGAALQELVRVTAEVTGEGDTDRDTDRDTDSETGPTPLHLLAGSLSAISNYVTSVAVALSGDSVSVPCPRDPSLSTVSQSVYPDTTHAQHTRALSTEDLAPPSLLALLEECNDLTSRCQAALVAHSVGYRPALYQESMVQALVQWGSHLSPSLSGALAAESPEDVMVHVEEALQLCYLWISAVNPLLRMRPNNALEGSGSLENAVEGATAIASVLTQAQAYLDQVSHSRSLDTDTRDTVRRAIADHVVAVVSHITGTGTADPGSCRPWTEVLAAGQALATAVATDPALATCLPCVFLEGLDACGATVPEDHRDTGYADAASVSVSRGVSGTGSEGLDRSAQAPLSLSHQCVSVLDEALASLQAVEYSLSQGTHPAGQTPAEDRGTSPTVDCVGGCDGIASAVDEVMAMLHTLLRIGVGAEAGAVDEAPPSDPFSLLLFPKDMPQGVCVSPLGVRMEDALAAKVAYSDPASFTRHAAWLVGTALSLQTRCDVARVRAGYAHRDRVDEGMVRGCLTVEGAQELLQCLEGVVPVSSADALDCLVCYASDMVSATARYNALLAWAVGVCSTLLDTPMHCAVYGVSESQGQAPPVSHPQSHADSMQWVLDFVGSEYAKPLQSGRGLLRPPPPFCLDRALSLRGCLSPEAVEAVAASLYDVLPTLQRCRALLLRLPSLSDATQLIEAWVETADRWCGWVGASRCARDLCALYKDVTENLSLETAPPTSLSQQSVAEQDHSQSPVQPLRHCMALDEYSDRYGVPYQYPPGYIPSIGLDAGEGAGHIVPVIQGVLGECSPLHPSPSSPLLLSGINHSLTLACAQTTHSLLASMEEQEGQAAVQLGALLVGLPPLPVSLVGALPSLSQAQLQPLEVPPALSAADVLSLPQSQGIRPRRPVRSAVPPSDPTRPSPLSVLQGQLLGGYMTMRKREGVDRGCMLNLSGTDTLRGTLSDAVSGASATVVSCAQALESTVHAEARAVSYCHLAMQMGLAAVQPLQALASIAIHSHRGSVLAGEIVREAETSGHAVQEILAELSAVYAGIGRSPYPSSVPQGVSPSALEGMAAEAAGALRTGCQRVRDTQSSLEAGMQLYGLCPSQLMVLRHVHGDTPMSAAAFEGVVRTLRLPPSAVHLFASYASEGCLSFPSLVQLVKSVAPGDVSSVDAVSQLLYSVLGTPVHLGPLVEALTPLVSSLTQGEGGEADMVAHDISAVVPLLDAASDVVDVIRFASSLQSY
ncbi:hypothetical protein KIPB_001768 [Kipferlia bialata]|uniref:Uncharacterized protein n=1 Tax=Kipferlia bialata TaxID=797122 RepID=A0A9K3GFI3_9EUKA|nr:hypothetical protein KIPB_001768 [Kipferlia bialata]|eukprot:g1768.t1